MTVIKAMDIRNAPLDPGSGIFDLTPERLRWEFTDVAIARAIWDDDRVLPMLAAALRVPRVELWVEGVLYDIWTARPLPLPLPTRSSSASRDQERPVN